MATASYPPARTRDPSSLVTNPNGGELDAGPGGNARNFPFHMREASGVSIAVTPSILGPAILDELVIAIGRGLATPFASLQLYIADDEGNSGANQATNTVPTGEPVFDSTIIVRDDAVGSTDRRGLPLFDMAEANTGFMRIPIKRVTRKQRFYCKIRIQDETAGPTFIMGNLRVIEAVAEDVLANFR